MKKILFCVAAVIFSFFCISSKKPEQINYELLKIKSYTYWDLYLHENQCYLGRTFVQLKDKAMVDDFLSINAEARNEFFLIGQEVKNALNILFIQTK